MTRADLDTINPAGLTEAGIRDLIYMAKGYLDQASTIAALAQSVVQLGADVEAMRKERDAADHDRIVLLGTVQQVRILLDGLDGALEHDDAKAAANSAKIAEEAVRQALKQLRVKP